MITADYHMHSHHSGDSHTPTEEMVKTAISKGLTRICFTEHNDPDYIYVKPHETGMFDLNTEAYYKNITELKKQYAGQIQIHFGVELGIQPDICEKLEKYASSYPFEFIIASSHVCQKKDPYYPSYYDGISIKQGLRDYFEEILENVSRYKNYDIYGHLDYIVRYIPEERKNEYVYSFSDFKDVFEAILKTIIHDGKGIELNTSGLGKSIHNTNPCPEIIRFYKELGGEIITVGADAHFPENIALEFKTAEKILLQSGFSYYCTFEDRKVSFHNLAD